MGKKGLLLCVCQGTCPSFEQMNIFEVANAIRREKLVDYVAIHPQLCAEDGDQFLEALLASGETEKLFAAGCDPVMQKKMFRDAFEVAGFDGDSFTGIEIRNLTTEQALDTIKKAIAESG